MFKSVSTAMLLAVPVWLVLYWFQSDAAGLFCPGGQLSYWYLLLIAPLLEEIVFRGLLQAELTKTRISKFNVGPISLANGLTSLAFALAHMFRLSVIGIVTLFPSLVLGWLYERCAQRIWPCVLVHGLYNAGLLLVLQC